MALQLAIAGRLGVYLTGYPKAVQQPLRLLVKIGPPEGDPMVVPRYVLSSKFPYPASRSAQ